jgi:FkbM family methyltransferase
MKFYSQFQQDQFVYNVFFKDKENGVFVDIGAHDGETDSNSLFFENLGWKGFCIEPNPEMFSKLQSIRKCKCLPYAVGDKNQTLQFFQIKEASLSVLSGLVDEFSQSAIHRINDYNLEDTQQYEYIDVECKTFDSLIDVYDIDFLSLDTEGNELKILQSIDFTKYNIDVITVENNDYDNKFLDFFNDKNYSLVVKLGCDEVYKKIK